MANSEVGICNLALSLLNAPPITSIDTPNSKTAETCKLWYDQVRREALRRHAWNFAIKRVILSASTTAPVFGYNTAFDLPSDYIRIMQVNATDGYRDSPIQQDRYTVENKRLLMGEYTTDSSTQLRLVYVSDFTTVSQMDASFKDYFITLLGQKLAYPVTQSNSAVERMDALMEKAETRARSHDGQESPPKRINRSKMLQARRNQGSVSNYDGRVVFD